MHSVFPPVLRSTLFLIAVLVGAESYAKSNLAIGQDVYEEMQQAQLFIEQEQFAAAKEVLERLFGKKRLNDYEKAQILSMTGNLLYQQEEYPEAIEKFQQAVEFDKLPEGYLQATLRTITQLMFMQERLDEALEYAQRMMAIQTAPDPFSHVLLSQIYYRQDKLDPALSNILKAIELERARGSQPSQNWLLILNAIYYGKNRFSDMVAVYKELIANYPKPVYVKNLAAIYGQQEKTEKQLLLLEPLYEKGDLSGESEIINLANLMILHKVPFKAARVIERGFQDGIIKRNKRNLELLAQSWLLAAEDERSVKYLEEVAKLSKDGASYLRLAQSYISMYHWKQAESALVKSIELGKLDEKEGNAWLLLGMARFYQKDYRSARKAMREAEKFDAMARMAAQWIVFMDQERAKAEAADG